MSELHEANHASHINSSSRPRPQSWSSYRADIRQRWAKPFLFLDWLSQWAAYGLSRTSLFELLEYCGSFSILLAVAFYFIDAPERTKMKHYQAWQVINSAQGKGGNGGRIDALRELNEDHVSLLGVDVSDSFLQGVNLPNSDLTRGNLSSADMREADLSNSKLIEANLRWTNLINADLSRADLNRAEMDDADLTGANLQGMKNWRSIESIRRATIQGVRNPPAGFVQWAREHGAVESDAADPRPASTTRP